MGEIRIEVTVNEQGLTQLELYTNFSEESTISILTSAIQVLKQTPETVSSITS